MASGPGLRLMTRCQKPEAGPATILVPFDLVEDASGAAADRRAGECALLPAHQRPKPGAHAGRTAKQQRALLPGAAWLHLGRHTLRRRGAPNDGPLGDDALSHILRLRRRQVSTL